MIKHSENKHITTYQELSAFQWTYHKQNVNFVTVALWGIDLYLSQIS